MLRLILFESTDAFAANVSRVHLVRVVHDIFFALSPLYDIMMPIMFPCGLPPLAELVGNADPTNVGDVAELPAVGLAEGVVNEVDSLELYEPARPAFVFTAGTVQPGSLEDVIVATHELCRTLGKVAKQKRRNPRRIEMICGMSVRVGDGLCPFYVNAVTVSLTLLKITTVNTNHTCGSHSARRRQVKSSILGASSPTLFGFVPSKGRKGGNAFQLQTQMKVQHGISLKKVKLL